MRVDLQNINQNVDMDTNTYRIPKQEEGARIAELTSGYSLDITGNVTDNMAYKEEGLKSAQEISAEAGRLDVNTQRDYMAVMSNSMSTEDFAKLQEEGYNPGEIEPEDIVTNLDKIKAVMAESGNIISGYNDDLSAEDMMKITGSSVKAEEIKAALHEKDLPATEDNVMHMMVASEECSRIKQVTDGTLKFLLQTGAEPTIENIYKAEYSKGWDQIRRYGYIKENGYVTQAAQAIDWDQIKDAVENVIDEAGLSDDPKAIEESRFMLEQGIPLTADNLQNLHSLKQIEIPRGKDLFNKMADAISVGRNPQQTNLLNGQQKSSYVKQKRILLESSLKMSIEANRSLARKGLVIDTAELERAVDQLKEAEKELFGQAMDIIQDVAEQPAESIGIAAFDTSTFTLKSLHEIGQPLKSKYEAALQSYEAVWTAPRADMGDSIKKAFRNVDDILKDMNIEVNELSRKTVRIMGYTQTEINEANYARVAQATEAVLDVIQEMTPERTLEMIRDGFNPLTENILDVAKYLKQKPESKSADDYSEYIWKLDKNHEITDDEREAYIGICRLIRQIEKNDGRPIGDVLSSDEQLTLENLLTAVRSRKAAGLDVTVDDAFGTLEELKDPGKSITDQIMKAFDQVLNSGKTQEADLEFAQELRQECKEATLVSDDVINTLLSSDLPVNTDNLLAVDHLMHMRGMTFKSFFKLTEMKDTEEKKEAEATAESLKDKLDSDSFTEDYIDFAQRAQRVVNEATFQSIDAEELKNLRMIHKQLHVAKGLARQENYEVPMEISGERTSINLRIVRGKGSSEAVICFETEQYGAVCARLTSDEKGVSGYVTGSRSAVESLQAKRDDFGNRLGRDVSRVAYLESEQTGIRYLPSSTENKTPVKDLYRIAKAFLNSL